MMANHRNQFPDADTDSPGFNSERLCAVMKGFVCMNCGYTSVENICFCPRCGAAGEQKELDKVCNNCQSQWREGDRFCRYCGAPMDQPGYRIREFACIYGPRPVTREHKCPHCHYTWRTDLMIDKETFCPRCGKPLA